MITIQRKALYGVWLAALVCWTTVPAAWAVSARAELKQMSDTLSSAKSMSFVATTMKPLRVPGGGWIHIFSTAAVELKRPDLLHIKTSGDAFPQEIYFDGSTFSVLASGLMPGSVSGSKFYSQASMPGSIEQMLAKASDQFGYVFPFADVLVPHPYEAWSKNLHWAHYIGESIRGDERLQHFAFASPKTDWEVWTDEKTHLPRIVFVKYLGVERSPTILIEFTHWKLNTDIAAQELAFHLPPGGKKVPFRAPPRARKRAGE